MIEKARQLLALAEQAGIPLDLIGAVLVGLLISWTGTQYLKRRFSLWGDRATGLGFVLAALPVLSLAWTHGLYAFWLALLTGFSATGSYKLLVRFARSRWRWVAELSNDPDEHEGGAS